MEKLWGFLVGWVKKIQIYSKSKGRRSIRFSKKLIVSFFPGKIKENKKQKKNRTHRETREILAVSVGGL